MVIFRPRTLDAGLPLLHDATSLPDGRARWRSRLIQATALGVATPQVTHQTVTRIVGRVCTTFKPSLRVSAHLCFVAVRRRRHGGAGYGRSTCGHPRLTLQEYVLKGVVHAALGQASGDEEKLKLAQQFFQLVGASASECDTIPGRQCMASCFYLLHQFNDVLIFLNSIQEYFKDDDDYNWNFGIAQANIEAWPEVCNCARCKLSCA
jgi:hypothetical protein